MLKVELIISIFIFLFLLGITSMIKNKTRIIEKNIHKIDKNIAIKIKDLNETQLDYFYLSSPSSLAKKIKEIDLIEYEPMSYSKIYLNLNSFISSQKKISNLNTSDEKKTKK